MSENNQGSNEANAGQDLSDGTLPVLMKLDASQLVIEKWHARIMMGLRLGSLAIALVLAGLFLCKGLVYTEKAIYSVVNGSHNTASLAPTAKTAEKQESKSSTASNTEQTARLPAPKQPEKWDKALISSGSIITLIAFILGVGLTLLLAVIKLSVAADKKEENSSPNVGIVGPLGELIMLVVEKIKGK